MEIGETKLEFTNDEMERLLLMVAIGNGVINGVREDCLDEFEAVEKKLFQIALESGVDRYLDKDKVAPDNFPNQEFEEVMMRYVDEYDDYTFWGELEYRLIERDMLRKYGPDQLAKMSIEERIEKEEEFDKKYHTEFSENGLENISIEKNNNG